MNKPNKQDEMWQNLNYKLKLQILEAESFVLIDLLSEDAELIKLIKLGESKKACLKHINESF